MGGVTPPVPLPHAVLALAVHWQQPFCYLNSTLRSLHPPLLALPKSWSIPRRLSLVGILRHPAWCVVWLEYHANHLHRFCPWSDPVEDAGEEVKLPLDMEFDPVSAKILHVTVNIEESYEHVVKIDREIRLVK